MRAPIYNLRLVKPTPLPSLFDTHQIRTAYTPYMAVIGLTIVAISLSLLFCTSRGPSFFHRLWSADPFWARGKIKAATAPSIRLNASVDDESSDTRLPILVTDEDDWHVNPAAELEESMEPGVKADWHLEPGHSAEKPAYTSSIATSISKSIQTLPDSPRILSPRASDSQLMPPPPRPAPVRNQSATQPQHLQPARISPSNLRPLPAGPLPNRLPPASTNLSPATSSTLPASSRPRKKVLLTPGHSPLDWASLTRNTPSATLSGVPYPQRITPSQLAYNTGRKGKPAWSSFRGNVYNITPYLPFHPGGEAELMRAAGRDGTALFEEIHPWVNWENMLGPCLVGFLVPDEEERNGAGGLEALD